MRTATASCASPGERYMIGVRPASTVDDIEEVRWLLEVARAATFDPDRASPVGMRTLLNVLDDKLLGLAKKMFPGGAA